MTFTLAQRRDLGTKKRQSQGGADTNVGGVGVRTSFRKKRGAETDEERRTRVELQTACRKKKM